MYDVIIIGAGPAGISASLYLKRAKQDILVIGAGYGALEKADKIENYYGIREPISGKELVENGIYQAKRLGVEMIEDEVVSIEKEKYFKVTTINRDYEARKVILATGANRRVPNIKGIKQYEGKGVSYCAVCDAFFYRNKDVVVLGNGNYATHEAKHLKQVANSVTILTNGEKMIENRDEVEFPVEVQKIKEFRGGDIIEEVEFEDHTTKKIHGVFVAMGTASSSDLAKKIGAVIQNSQIQVNENMQTTVEGLYACGDCTGGLLQISKAVYEGAKAALHIIANKEGGNENVSN